jgi:hypothetical protein
MWFGIGKVSNHFNDGFSSIFGYFYPSDIGLLGGVLLYGIIGAIFIYALPMIFAVKLLKDLAPCKSDFILSMKYSLLFAMVMPQQEVLFFEPVNFAIPFVVLLAYRDIFEGGYEASRRAVCLRDSS